MNWANRNTNELFLVMPTYKSVFLLILNNVQPRHLRSEFSSHCRNKTQTFTYVILLIQFSFLGFFPNLLVSKVYLILFPVTQQKNGEWLLIRNRFVLSMLHMSYECTFSCLVIIDSVIEYQTSRIYKLILNFLLFAIAKSICAN